MVKRIFGNRKLLIIIAAAIAAVTIGGFSISSNAAMSVSAYAVDKGVVDSEVEVNGTVESNTERSYYSDVNAKVSTIHVKEGDFVKKGDLIISYDLEEIKRLETMAELKAQADLGSYNNSMQTGGRTAGLYSEAKTNLAVLDQQITDTQTAITNTQNKLAQRKADLADFGAKLQISLIDWADKPDSDEYENLQKLVQTNAYEQQYADDIVQMQEELNALNTQLANYKEYKAEMTSQKASTVMGLMTSGARDQLAAVKESNELATSLELEDYARAKEGIRAEFDGVVTQIDAVEGGSIAKYAGTDITVSFSVTDDIPQENGKSESFIKIRIRDNGPGVDKDDLPLIAEKYYRGKNASDKSGYGLGMYLCKMYMNKQGGGMEYYNDGGFVVELVLRKV